MTGMKSLLAGLGLGLAALSTATPAATQDAGTYRNPVIDSDFPDPSVLLAPDGFYYVYATQGDTDRGMANIQLARSRDLVHWTRLADALPVKPGWASRTQDFWAPHVVRQGGVYYLYYSAKPDAALSDKSRGLCLAVATASAPQGPFTDSGQPLQCGEGFVNIDPMAFDDPATGKRLLYWGSGFGPIHVRELAPDRVSFALGSRAVDLVWPVPAQSAANYRRLVEGAWVIRRRGWYYLFFSDGHNAVIADARGRLWMLYHGVDAARPRTRPSDQVNTRRVMLLDSLTFRHGWPTVARGTPSNESRPAPAVP